MKLKLYDFHIRPYINQDINKYEPTVFKPLGMQTMQAINI